MHKDILVFFWLNGSIRFMSMSRGQPVAVWECTERIDPESSADLARIVVEGVERTQYAGKDLAVVLETPLVTQQLLETPPAKGRDLESFIERQIDHLKIIPERVAWAFQPVHPTRGSNGVMLYLLPEAVRNRLRTVAQVAGLHLLMLVPPSALLVQLIGDVPIGEREVALLAVEISGSVSLVAARKDGKLFMTRSLPSSWELEPERIASQIYRSLVFVRQQFGVDITRLHLAGRAVPESVMDLLGKTGVSITTGALDLDSSWPRLVANLSPRTSANLITREQQRAPRRRLELMICATMLGVSVLAGLVVSLTVEYRLHQTSRKVESSQSKLADLQMKKSDLNRQFDQLSQDGKLISYVNTARMLPVPGIFTAYVASKLPAELILTKLRVLRVDCFSDPKNPSVEERWTVRLEGCVSWQGSDDADSGKAHDAYAGLVNELAEGPFRLSITDRTKLFAPRRQKPSWTTTSNKDQSEQFFIEGVIPEHQLVRK
jgi:hypothetical protein